MVRLTQENFDNFVIALNHRMTKVEESTKWIKYIVGYMATIITATAINTMFIK